MLNHSALALLDSVFWSRDPRPMRPLARSLARSLAARCLVVVVVVCCTPHPSLSTDRPTDRPTDKPSLPLPLSAPTPASHQGLSTHARLLSSPDRRSDESKTRRTRGDRRRRIWPTTQHEDHPDIPSAAHYPNLPLSIHNQHPRSTTTHPYSRRRLTPRHVPIHPAPTSVAIPKRARDASLI